MKKILLLGPFPIGEKGLNGHTIANQILYDSLKQIYGVYKINTLKNLNFTNKDEQGKFKLRKFLKIFLTGIYEVFHILLTNYDVVYMTPGQSFLGFMRFSPYMLCCIVKKIPYYIHIHGGNFRNIYDKQNRTRKKIIRRFLNRATGIIVLGNSLKKMLEGIVNNKKIFICENGVQDNIIATKEEIEEKIKRIKNNSKRKVLYLSNLMEEKGILELLKAIESFSVEKIELNLAGAIEPKIKNIIEEYLNNYSNKINYHGIVSGEKKKRLFLNNDIFVLPSWDEGQPISILEAYVTGCSVITDPNIGGIGDIFTTGVNGESCKAKDSESLIKALKKITKMDEVGLQNYLEAKNKYTREKFVERIQKIILRIEDSE